MSDGFSRMGDLMVNLERYDVVLEMGEKPFLKSKDGSEVSLF